MDGRIFFFFSQHVLFAYLAPQVAMFTQSYFLRLFLHFLEGPEVSYLSNETSKDGVIFAEDLETWRQKDVCREIRQIILWNAPVQLRWHLLEADGIKYV